MDKKYIVITRPEEETKLFAEEQKKLGLQPFFCATTKQIKNITTSEFEEYLSLLATYDWLIFTSSKGVEFFMEALTELGEDLKPFKKLQIAAVGEKTAETARHHGLHIDFVPSTFTSDDLVQEMPSVNGKKLLLPRSVIGNPELEKHLEEKGALVTDMPLYTTVTQKNNMDEFWKLRTNHQIAALTFMSPSAVIGLVENVDKRLDEVLEIPVISIGPVTTAALGKYQFNHIYTATPHTTEGMITKMKESIL